MLGKVICVTNRHLVDGDYLVQVGRALERHPYALILREKDLSAEAYLRLAKQVMSLCRQYNVRCILHNSYDAAGIIGSHYIHLPLNRFENMPRDIMRRFDEIGVSVHSVEDAVKAQKLGASYITAGHVFDTECKKGVPSRGISFLKDVCNSVSIPVYAIGGVHEHNIKQCIDAGAAGVCMMSDFMCN